MLPPKQMAAGRGGFSCTNPSRVSSPPTFGSVLQMDLDVAGKMLRERHLLVRRVTETVTPTTVFAAESVRSEHAQPCCICVESARIKIPGRGAPVDPPLCRSARA